MVAAAQPWQPMLTTCRPGVVHLNGDAGNRPLSRVKDLASGAVPGLVHGGSAEFSTAARELEVNL